MMPTSHGSCLVVAPLPNECLYSLASHHTEKWFHGTAPGAKSILGSSTLLARDLVGNLNELARSFSTSANMTGERLALKHTALPVYLPFSDRLNLIECACSGRALQLRLGIAPSRLTSARALRYCPECAKLDRKQFGRAYWHREHQLAGVLVCPHHGIALVATNVCPNWRHGSGGFVSLEKASPDIQQNLTAAELRGLTGVAKDFQWLLDNPSHGPGCAHLHSYYRSLAHESGYRQSNGSVAVARLRESVELHYGRRLLERIGSGLSQHRGDWLPVLIRKPRSLQQPLRHLLLLRFFGISVEEALNAAAAHKPLAVISKPHAHRIRRPDRLKQLLPIKRSSWSTVLATKQGPERAKTLSLYCWLWRNDRDWLRRQRRPRPTRQSDFAQWQMRDEQLARRVCEIAFRLKEDVPLVRASRNLIASNSGKAAWLVRDHPLLPRATAAIKFSSESAVEFALRRIARHTRQHGFPAQPWRIRVACGISVELAHHPDVARALRHDRA